MRTCAPGRFRWRTAAVHRAAEGAMDEHSGIPYLRETVIFLAAAGVVVPVFHRLRISPVLGYLIVGGIIGPFGLGLWIGDVPVLSYAVIRDIEGVRALAELGVVFLLFMIGLELSLDRLWAMRRLVFGLGSLQIFVTGTVIGALAWAFGNPPSVAIVLGACLALSSTAIVMQILMQGHRLGTPLGRSSFAILLMQDLAVVPILFAVGILGAGTNGFPAVALFIALTKAVLAIGLIYAVGRLALRPALHIVAQTRSPEMFTAAILLTVIGISAITGMAGLSMATGAFLAGLLLAETEYRHEIEVDIEPFKGLMLGLFFMSVGMGIDWRVIAAEPIWIIASVCGLFAVKATVIAGLSRVFGLPRHSAVEAGLLLGQGGEFAFIVLALAARLELIEPDLEQFMLIVTGLTMLGTPLVAAGAARLGRRLERLGAGSNVGDIDEVRGIEGHVVLAGFGRVGETLARTLQAEAVPYVALDADPVCVAMARTKHLPVFFGDAARLEMLKRAGLDTCRAVVITMNAPESAERIIREIRHRWPLVPVFARARDALHAARLRNAGATVALPETVEASLQLAGRVLDELGASEEAVRRRIEEQRAIEDP